MANERKAIRDAVKDALHDAYPGSIYTSRNIDVRDEKEYVNIYFESGDIEYEGVSSLTTATLVVAFNTKEQPDDDGLDLVADQLNQALADADIAPDIIRGMLPAGFAYPSEEEAEFTTINLLYTVYY